MDMPGRKTVRYLLLALLISIGLLCTYVQAEQTQLEASDIVVTTGIRDRMPVDAVQSYAASVDALYCYSRITGAGKNVTISHVWYHDGREVARVALPVGSPNWRTWSKKTVPETGRGNWRVDVLDEQGRLLGSRKFRLL
jgi:hypothetical protein